MLHQNLKKYNEDGFVIIRNLLPKASIPIIKKEITKISKILVKDFKPPYVHLTKDFKLNTAHHLNKIFPKSKLMKLAKNKKINALLEKKFKEKILMKNFEIFAKPNKTGGRVPFHQDNFYWNIKDEKAANLWIALNKVNKLNGGIIYYKGSHKLGLKKHTKSNVPGSSQELQKKIIDKIKLKKVSPNLNPGDCIVHHCNVVHGSSKNKSKKKRLGVAIRFVSKNAKVNKKEMSKYLKSFRK
jgi:phytanoyl-CoA hydroxylase